MVADKVELLTRRAGESQAFRWSATGGEGYSIEESERASQGTTITLTLKPVNEDDGLRDFTSEWVLRDIVKKYSDFVSYPVKLEVEREEAKLNADGEAEDGGERRGSEREQFEIVTTHGATAQGPGCMFGMTRMNE